MHLARLLMSIGILLVLALITPSSLAAAQPTTPTRVPFVVGLTTVKAVSTPQGDYESLSAIDTIDSAGYRIAWSAELPDDDGDGTVEISVLRRVNAEDQRSARKMRNYYQSGDPQTFPGTVPAFSAAVMNDLRTTGKAAFTYVKVNQLFGLSSEQLMTGTLIRVGVSSTQVPVNGHQTALPVIHAKAHLSDGSDDEDYEYDVLDDLNTPMLLAWRGGDVSTRILRIEYPEATDAPTSIEHQLAANQPVQIYGIYFEFAKANIRPQSERVLNEIAAILKTHPDWKLRVDGHTDNVGGDAANLELSKRRAAAVKTALVTRYHIDSARLSTDGHGASSPREKNDTPERRALNRRVELRRE
jgi:outer membrane protein OmpA-like peptidoglycan-associated protein